MGKNKDNKKVEVEVQVKRKSRFGVVLGVVVVGLGLTFSYLTLAQKEKYTVLASTSKEVKSMISNIKDIRTLKGFKIIEQNSENKLVLISAGLSYDPEGSIEVSNVEFGKNSAKITVKENINKNPEKERVTYPFIVIKLKSEISNIEIVNENGEVYEEIFLNQHTNESPVKVEEEKVDTEEKEEDAQEETQEEEDAQEEETQEDEQASQSKTLTCIYEGKADGTTIEISIGNEYRTFDISEVSSSFDNMEAGKQITIEYVDTLGNGKIISVK